MAEEIWSALRSRFFAPTAGDVRNFGNAARMVVSHSEFQRLRKVKQLGLVHYVYPGAHHTRFEHSVGTFGAAIQYLRVLSGRGMPEFRSWLRDDELKMTAAMALVHDVGHYPFAHIIDESNVGNFPRHEDVTVKLLELGLAGKVAEAFGFDEDKFLEFSAFCLGRRVSKRFYRRTWEALRDVINGPIDADKFDYLRRDALHAGVPYTWSLDLERFLGGLTVIKGRGKLRLAVMDKSLSSAEMFAVGRYFMYTSVYFHHTVRAFDRMLQEIVSCYLKSKVSCGAVESSVFEELRLLSDELFINRIVEGCGCDSLVSGIRDRLPYKRLLESREDQDEPWLDKAIDQLSDPGKRFRLEGLLREFVGSACGHSFEEGELLVDLPRKKMSQAIRIPIVEGANKILREEAILWRSIADIFSANVWKIRVFAREIPKKWGRDFELGLRNELRDIIREVG